MSFQGIPGEVLTVAGPDDPGPASDGTMSEPLIGYRCWLVEDRPGGPQLCGVLTQIEWADRPGAWTRAFCSRLPVAVRRGTRDHSEEVPHAYCTCGLYAYHGLSGEGYDDLVEVPKGPGFEVVWGAVVAAGRVLAYEEGWRAQYARPVALLQRSDSGPRVRGVADQLGIPVVPLAGIAHVAAEFGVAWRVAASPSHALSASYR